jgi:hypothetical protein
MRQHLSRQTNPDRSAGPPEQAYRVRCQEHRSNVAAEPKDLTQPGQLAPRAMGPSSLGGILCDSNQHDPLGFKRDAMRFETFDNSRCKAVPTGFTSAGEGNNASRSSKPHRHSDDALADNRRQINRDDPRERPRADLIGKVPKPFSLAHPQPMVRGKFAPLLRRPMSCA